MFLAVYCIPDTLLRHGKAALSSLCPSLILWSSHSPKERQTLDKIKSSMRCMEINHRKGIENSEESVYFY